jgi:hypothetical protein
MQSGYALCTPDKLRVLCLTKNPTKVELLEIKEKNSLNRALCLPDLTSIKSIYERFKERNLVEELDIVNVARLYKQHY